MSVTLDRWLLAGPYVSAVALVARGRATAPDGDVLGRLARLASTSPPHHWSLCFYKRAVRWL